jgi:hypothetical protein
MTKTKVIGSIVAGLLATVAIVFLGPNVAGLSQTSRMRPSSLLSVQPSSDSSIEIVAYDRASQPVFADLLDRPEWSHVGRIAVVVTNRSAQPITGLVVQWSVPTPEGPSKLHTLQVDQYVRTDQSPVLPARGRALVTPSGVILEEQIGTQFVTSALTSASLTSGLSVSARIPVNVDSVIWSDGRVSGPDAFDVIGYITSRHAVANEIASQMAARRGDQVEVERVLSDLASSATAAGPGTNHAAHWTLRLVASARRGPERLSQLLDAPVPQLYRAN